MEYSICKKPRPGRRAASYARFSSHNQRSESIEIQHDNNLAYCAIEDLDVVAIYSDEAKSGRNTNRADFQSMVADAKAGLFDYVVIYKVTRIMRNRDEMALLRITLRKYGVEILYSGESIGSGSDAILQLGLKEVLAEWESAQLSERIRDGIKKNAERCMANGQILFGWDIVDGYYEINESQAHVLRKVKDMLFRGETMAECVRAVAGYKNSRGKPFRQNALTKVMQRKQNAGIYCYAGVEKADGMPALWPLEEQRMLWSILGDKTTPRRKAMNADFALTGKLWCGECRLPMSGTSGTSTNGKTYYYYACKKGCRRKVRKEALEESVACAVRDALGKPENRERVADLVCECEWESDGSKLSDTIRGELKEIDLTYERIWRAIEKGEAPPGGEERIQQLGERKELLDDELKIALSIEKVRLDRDRILYWLESVAESADSKALINVFVSRVVLFGNDDLQVLLLFDAVDDGDGWLRQMVERKIGSPFVLSSQRSTTIGELVEHPLSWGVCLFLRNPIVYICVSTGCPDLIDTEHLFVYYAYKLEMRREGWRWMVALIQVLKRCPHGAARPFSWSISMRSSRQWSN